VFPGVTDDLHPRRTLCLKDQVRQIKSNDGLLPPAVHVLRWHTQIAVSPICDLAHTSVADCIE
jgi:hypothetical protein